MHVLAVCVRLLCKGGQRLAGGLVDGLTQAHRGCVRAHEWPAPMETMGRMLLMSRPFGPWEMVCVCIVPTGTHGGQGSRLTGPGLGKTGRRRRSQDWALASTAGEQLGPGSGRA